MEDLSKTKVSRIVATNYRTARVFTFHGIDFCCNGGISLDEACRNNQVDLNEVIMELDKVLKLPQAVNYNDMGMDQLADRIVNEHHDYVRNTIPALNTYLDKLCKVHGERHPELFEIALQFKEAAQSLNIHMDKEEQVLFPYIKALHASTIGGFPLSTPHFGDIHNPISQMEMDHDHEGSRFRKIRALTNDFCPPRDSCQTYRVAFALLNEFEEDLHKHIHLENNLLFPMAKIAFQNSQS